MLSWLGHSMIIQSTILISEGRWVWLDSGNNNAPKQSIRLLGPNRRSSTDGNEFLDKLLLFVNADPGLPGSLFFPNMDSKC